MSDDKPIGYDKPIGELTERTFLERLLDRIIAPKASGGEYARCVGTCEGLIKLRLEALARRPATGKKGREA
jgi:hypothetical protein